MMMGTTPNAKEATAYEAMDKLLYREWDPIGVSHLDNWPEDEYRMYLPEFRRLAASGVEAKELADYLHGIERDRISLETTEERRLDIARKAIALMDQGT